MKTAEKALRAIVARIDGEWDEPNLVEHGALYPDTLLDVRNIAADALKVAGESEMRTFTVSIGANLRGYTEMEIAATSAESARENAFDLLKKHGDGTTKNWVWRLEAVQGDVSVTVVGMLPMAMRA